MRFGRLRIFPSLAAFLLILGCIAAPALGAEPAAEPSAKASGSPDEVQQLIDILENDAARQRLVDRLRASVGEPETKPAPDDTEPGGIATRSMTAIADSATDAGAHVIDVLSFVADAPRFLRWLKLEASQPQIRMRVLLGLRDLAIALGAGLLVELILRLVARRWRSRLEKARFGTFWRRSGARLLYAGLGLGPIVGFWIAATLALALIQPTETTSLIAATLINAHTGAQFLVWIIQLVFVPQSPVLRLAPLPDPLAANVNRWISRTARIAIYGYGLCLATLFIGLPQVLVSFLMRLLGLTVAGLLIVLVLRLRHAIAGLIRDAASGSALQLNTPVARYWHLPIIAYILVALFVWLASPGDAMAFLVRATVVTIVLVGIAVAVVLTAGRVMGRWVQHASWVKDRGFAFRRRVTRYLQGMRIVLSTVAVAATTLTVIEVWGVDSEAWFESIGGPRLISGLLSIGIILVIAIVAWEAVSVVIERRLAAADDGTLDGLRRAARLRTLMPLFDRITFLALAAAVVLIGLSELGIDIAPLLAGAGVVGIAVGFGAQALVKDILGGMSAILEGSMSVGDIVAVVDKSGVVESMSLRTLKLRDFDGTVHTIPFGEITRVSNLTKDYSYAVLRIPISYKADVEQVQELIKTIIGKMREDPQFKGMILDDVELHGIDSFSDTAVVVLARVKVAPARQWTVTREFHVRLKEAFDRQGVGLPFVQRTLTLGSTQNPPPPPQPTAATKPT